MVKYLQKLKELSSAFKNFEIQQILRMENAHADALSRLATSGCNELNIQVFLEHLEKLVILQVDHKPSWMDSLIDNLINSVLPTNLVEAQKIKWQTPSNVSLGKQNFIRDHICYPYSSVFGC